ncbi:hypothetical protein BCR35DRAFT_300452 [Leucosporidium creatinivorum]|uniref:START domain-containing protein n=1 Tax=Leucosporidium creatinivorum TaxID=106004 RepID=A0A1Y2G1C5_9BASI|nr:hypothetical protein BCR35DRAFT_300452 [Leucosporidium creatinivorum]
MATAQSSQVSDGSRSIVALLFAVTPLYLFSVQARSRLGFDNLHLGLLQVVLLLIMSHLSSYIPSNLFGRPGKSKIKAKDAAPASSPAAAATAEPTPTPAPAATSTQRRTPTRRASPSTAPSAPKSNDRFPSSLLDDAVAKFLTCTAPEHLPLLPTTTSSEPSTPLSAWKTLHEAESLKVLKHPSTSGLYAICAQFPGVPVRKLYESLTDISRRTAWDGMCRDAKEIEEVEVDVEVENGAEGEEKGYRMLRGNVVWIGMKGMALIKAKDMVLLSIAGRLPSSTPSESPSRSESSSSAPLQIFCATTSFSHPSVPPKSDFNRMELGISGFLIEEDGEGGSKIVQVTDLSGLGSWVPSAVIRTVTQTLLPKSLSKLGRTARALDLTVDSKYPLEGDAWMPPLLGEAVPLSSLPSPPTSHGTEADDEDSASSTLADSDSDGALSAGDSRKEKERLPSAASAREIHTLVNQLRSVTARLNALEASTGEQAERKGWLASLPTILGGGGGVEQGQLQAFGGSKAVALTALGGAAGAAIVLGVLKGWERRRR